MKIAIFGVKSDRNGGVIGIGVHRLTILDNHNYSRQLHQQALILYTSNLIGRFSDVLSIELAEVCEVVIKLYYQEVWLVLDNIYTNYA